MDLEEAKAFSDGIDFHVLKQNMVISARRDENGDVSITKHLPREHHTDPMKNLEGIVVILLFSLVLSFILNSVSNDRLKVCITLVALWAGTFAYYFYQSKKKSAFSSYRYHAAEHKALNYLDRYEEAPIDIYFLVNTSSYSVRCGSTMVAVLEALVTLFALSITFLPFIWLKVLGCVLGLVIVFFLWAFDLLNFFQKFVIQEPSLAEVEVAYEGLKAYVEERKRVDTNEKKS